MGEPVWREPRALEKSAQGAYNEAPQKRGFIWVAFRIPRARNGGNPRKHSPLGPFG